MGFLSNASFSALDRVATSVLRFAVIWIVANALGADGQGQLALMRTVWLSGYALFSLGMELSTNFLAARTNDPKDLSRLAGNTLLYAIIVPILPGSIIWAIAAYTDYFGVVGTLVLWLLAGIWSQFILASLRGTLQGRGEFRTVFIGSLVQYAAVLLVLALLWANEAVTLRLVATVWVCGVLLAGVLYLGRLLKLTHWRLRFHPPTLNAQLRYGVHAYLNNVMTAVNLRIDTYLIQYFLPWEALGYYSLATAIAEVVIYIPSAFTRAILTQVSATQTLSRKVFSNLSGVCLTICIGIGACTPLLIPVFFPEFLESIPLVWILLPGCYLFGMAQVFCFYQMGMNKVRVAARAAFAALILTLVGNVALLPWIGTAGAAIASVIAYGAYFFILYKSIAVDEPLSIVPSFEWMRIALKRWLRP